MQDFSLTTADVERICGVCALTVFRWRRAGKIRAIRYGRDYLHSELEIIALAAARLAQEKVREERNGATIRTSRKLREYFSRHIVPIMGRGGLNLGHIRAIAAGLGYAKLSDLDETGVERVLRGMSALAKHTERKVAASAKKPKKRRRYVRSNVRAVARREAAKAERGR